MNVLLLASFQAALIACAVLLMEKLAGRWLTPRLRFALWSLVALRLLIVVPLKDPLQTSRPDWWTWQQGQHVATSVEPSSSAAPAGLPVLIQPPESSREPDTRRPLANHSIPVNRGARDPNALLSNQPLVSAPQQAASQAVAQDAAANHVVEPPQSTPWLGFFLWVTWLGGIAISLAMHVVSERKLRRHLARSGEAAAPDLQELVDRCAEQLGVRHAVAAILVDSLPSPAAYGWRHSKILLPRNIQQQLDQQELRFVLLHELAHLRHRDAWQNLGLAILQSVHWFNPVIRIAFQRLRDERELLRDEEALRALPHVPAQRCAATLVKLLPRQAAPHAQASLSALVPHRQTTKRRISMIIHPWQPKRLQLVPGLACLAVVAWAGLTHSFAKADAPASVPLQANNSEASDAQSIRVVRQTPEAEWRAPVRQKLQAKVSWNGEIGYESLFELFKQRTQLEFRATDYVFEDAPQIAALPVEMTIERALNLICQASHARWDIEPGGIYFASLDEQPLSTDLRFYDITPLIGSDQERAWELAERVMELSNRHDDWDWDDTTMRVWNGQLLVSQSEPMHQSVEAILNMLLRRESPKAPPMPAAHRELLQSRVSFDEPSIAQQIVPLLAKQGIPLVMYGDMFEAYLADRPFDKVPLSAVLQEFSWENGVEMAYQDGVLYWIEAPPMRTVAYDISDLIAPDPSEVERLIDDEGYDRKDALEEIHMNNSYSVVELVMDLSGHDVWDKNTASVMEWDGLLLVTNLDSVHHSVDSLLETARRAVRR